MQATAWRAPGGGSLVADLLRELLLAGEVRRDLVVSPELAATPTALLIVRPGKLEPLDVERAAEALGRVGVSL